MDNIDNIERLKALVSQFNNQFFAGEISYPRLNIADYIPIISQGSVGQDSFSYDIVKGVMNLDEDTLDTEQGRALILYVSRTALYTNLEIRSAAVSNINLSDLNLRIVHQAVVSGMFKTALVGHGEDEKVTGILNNKYVTPYKETSKKLSDMTANEVYEWLYTMYLKAVTQGGGRMIPDTLLLPEQDLGKLQGMKTSNRTDGFIVDPLEQLQKSVEKKGIDLQILSVPEYYELKGMEQDTKRLCFYCKDESVLVQNIIQAPQAKAPFEIRSEVYEILVKATYTGAVIMRPDNVFYVDYK